MAARSLDHHLSQFVRGYNGAKDAIAANDPPLHAFVFGHLCDFEAAQLMPWIDLGPSALAWLEPAFTQAANNEQLRAAHTTYLNKRSQLEKDLSAVVGKLDA